MRSKLAVFFTFAHLDLSIFGTTFAMRGKAVILQNKQTMKHIFTIILGMFACIHLSAQASAVVFAESGEKFTVYLNGEKKNSAPAVNVKINGLTSDFYQARIDFEDAAFADFSEGNFAVQRGSEVTYIVKRNKKGEFILRWYGQTDGVEDAGGKEAGTEVKSFAVVDDVDHSGHESDNIQINHSITVEEVPAAKTTVTQTTTTTTKGQPAKTAPSSGGNVSMGINVDGVNMGISINASEMGGMMDMNVEESHQTTVTTTTTTTTSQPEAPAKPVAPKPVAKPAPVAKPVAPAPAAPVGRCATSMAPASFSKAKDNISSNSFEDSKMTVAKQVTKANCPTAEQIVEIMGLFSFEENKIEYAKFAYDFCYNQGDYYEVNAAFTFESSIEELNHYLESK